MPPSSLEAVVSKAQPSFVSYWAVQVKSRSNGQGNESPSRPTVVVALSVPLAFPAASKEPWIEPLALRSVRPPEKVVLKVRSALIETGPGIVSGSSGEVPRMKHREWTVNVTFASVELSPATSNPSADPSEVVPA